MSLIRIITNKVMQEQMVLLNFSAMRIQAAGAVVRISGLTARTYERNSFGPKVRSICAEADSTAGKLSRGLVADISPIFNHGGFIAADIAFLKNLIGTIIGKLPPIDDGGKTNITGANEDTKDTGDILDDAATTIKKITTPKLKDVSSSSFTSCALYAAARRLDLGTTYSNNQKYKDQAAANYINKFQDTAFQISNSEGDLREKIGKGYALVWEPGIASSHIDYGHVAIVEEVGIDYVIVSQAGWSGSNTIPLSTLTKLWLIP